VGRNHVADKREDGHDHVLGNGDDVGASDLSDSDAAIGRVGCVKVNVVRADTSGDGNLELLGLGQTLSVEVTGVESAVMLAPVQCMRFARFRNFNVRCGDDDFGIDELLVELAVLALLVGGGDESVSLVLNPLAQPELVLGRA